MTKVAMMQPAFLPWQGLFELIYHSDKFIFLDDFQYSIQSHHTRNKLFTGKNQVDFYTVPVQKVKSFELPLNETLIIENDIWKIKILKRLSNIYAKSEHFKNIYPQIENWLTKNYTSLAHLNIEGIIMFCKIMGIRTDFLYSSDFSNEVKTTATRTNKVIELIKWSNCTTYLSAHGSFEYMKEDNYNYKNYPVLFQNYQPKPYKQIHSQDFVPYLSVLDALFNVGAEETLNMIKNGTVKWLTYEEMEVLKQGITHD